MTLRDRSRAARHPFAVGTTAGRSDPPILLEPAVPPGTHPALDAWGDPELFERAREAKRLAAPGRETAAPLEPEEDLR